MYNMMSAKRLCKRHNKKSIWKLHFFIKKNYFTYRLQKGRALYIINLQIPASVW